MDLYEDLVAQFKRERKRQGLSQEDLGKIGNASRNVITRMESGANTPSMKMFVEACRAMNCMVAVIHVPNGTDVSKARRVTLDIAQEDDEDYNLFEEIKPKEDKFDGDYDNWDDSIDNIKED